MLTFGFAAIISVKKLKAKNVIFCSFSMMLKQSFLFLSKFKRWYFEKAQTFCIYWVSQFAGNQCRIQGEGGGAQTGPPLSKGLDYCPPYPALEILFNAHNWQLGHVRANEKAVIFYTQVCCIALLVLQT